MADTTWTDIRQLCDGSLRWVWMAMIGERVYKAGVSNNKGAAQGHATRAADRLNREQRDRERERNIAAFVEPVIDFDAMERGPDAP